MRDRKVYEFGPFRLDPFLRQLLRDDKPVHLKSKLFDLLLLLVNRRGKIVTKEEILRHVWPHAFVEESNITVGISALRKVLDDLKHQRNYIETVSGQGYRFVAAVDVKQDTNGPVPRLAETDTAILPGGYDDIQLDSLAVLPFVNASNDPEVDYLTDGVTETLINRLSEIKGLLVMAYSTVSRLKATAMTPQEVGYHLGVKSVLSARVLKRHDQVTLSVELVRATDGALIWGEEFVLDLSNIIKIQQEIESRILYKLQLHFSKLDDQSFVHRYTDDDKAYQLYLKARHFLCRMTGEGARTAIGFFKQAIELDPGFALAYAGLADSYYRLASQVAAPSAVMPKAREAALMALKIDTRLTEAHISLGIVHMFYDYDWGAAEREFKIARSLNPFNPIVHVRYGIFLTLRGEYEKGLASLQRGHYINPLSAAIHYAISVPYYMTRRYDKAIEQLHTALAMDPGLYPARALLGFIYTLKGQFLQAEKEFEEGRPSGSPELLRYTGYLNALQGNRQAAMSTIQQLESLSERIYVSPYNKAIIHAALGDRDVAFKYLDMAYEDRSEMISWLKVNPEVDIIRSDARFVRLLRRVGHIR